MKRLSRLLIGACAASAMLPVAVHAQTVNPVEQVDTLEALSGKQPTFRRAQAKGLCATGYFTGQPEGRALSSAAVFSGQKIPVVARFSVGGGNPKSSDKSRSARGLALQFMLPNGEQWMTANISSPVYFVARAEDFAPFLQARLPDPATGKPDPAKIKAFSEAHPETTLQAAYFASAPVPASYGTVTYFGVNAFELVNDKGASQFVRWHFAPAEANVGLTDEQIKTMPDNFLADELRTRVAAAPVAFNFKLQLAEKEDQLVDPTKVWPATRKIVTAGRLVIDKVEADMGGACDKITFNPLALPAGMKPSADPVLLARPAAYGVSLGRRLAEANK